MFLITETQKDYELIDSGEGEKLERFGSIKVSRPDPQALWQKALSSSEWGKADAIFVNSWKTKKNNPSEWKISLGHNKFILKLSKFKHVGVFPEQFQNWNWIAKKISEAKRPISVLNLFGYTGGATLSALSAGAEVCHVDGSKTAVSWAKKNVEISGLSHKSVRWIVDDVRAFVERENKRGRKYDAIIMDPPAFGRGPKGEVWKIEKEINSLLDSCIKVLSNNPIFFIINGYASGYSHIAYKNVLELALKNFPGEVESGELAIRESSRQRLLPAGIFARWEARQQSKK